MFWWENLKERDNLNDLGINVRIILNWILKVRLAEVHWIHLAEDKAMWCALVNNVGDLLVP